jgi:hypothetical protein
VEHAKLSKNYPGELGSRALHELLYGANKPVTKASNNPCSSFCVQMHNYSLLAAALWHCSVCSGQPLTGTLVSIALKMQVLS